MAAMSDGAAAALGGGKAAIERKIILAAESCASMAELRRLYGFLVRRHYRLANPSLILAKLLRFAAVSSSGSLSFASRLLFHGLHHEQVHFGGSAFFYNTLIRGLVLRDHFLAAVSLFKLMRSRTVLPDQFSFTFLLKARAKCSQSGGADVHSLALKHGCLNSFSIHVYNALIHLYGIGGNSCAAHQLFDEIPNPDVISWSGLLTAKLTAGDLAGARRIFNSMPSKDLVSWTAMISGYSHHGQPQEALSLFRSMPLNLAPDEITLIGVISACAAVGDIATGTAIHHYADDNNLMMTSLRNALVDMYGKCGSTDLARKVFDEMPERNTITFNSMISAYGLQGNVTEALRLLWETPEPDAGSFLGALTACAHSGRVEEGRGIVEAMKKLGFEPGEEHYGCMVDMLGRAGRLEEAYEVVRSTRSIEDNHVVFGALLGGCGIHGDVAMAEKVVGELKRLRSKEGGYRLLLARVYASAGRREKVEEIRRRMVEDGAGKEAARSCIRLLPSLG